MKITHWHVSPINIIIYLSQSTKGGAIIVIIITSHKSPNIIAIKCRFGTMTNQIIYNTIILCVVCVSLYSRKTIRTVCTTRSPSKAAAADNCTGTRSHNHHWPIHFIMYRRIVSYYYYIYIYYYYYYYTRYVPRWNSRFLIIILLLRVCTYVRIIMLTRRPYTVTIYYNNDNDDYIRNALWKPNTYVHLGIPAV